MTDCRTSPSIATINRNYSYLKSLQGRKAIHHRVASGMESLHGKRLNLEEKSEGSLFIGCSGSLEGINSSSMAPSTELSPTCKRLVDRSIEYGHSRPDWITKIFVQDSAIPTTGSNIPGPISDTARVKTSVLRMARRQPAFSSRQYSRSSEHRERWSSQGMLQPASFTARSGPTTLPHFRVKNKRMRKHLFIFM